MLFISKNCPPFFFQFIVVFIALISLLDIYVEFLFYKISFINKSKIKWNCTFPHWTNSKISMKFLRILFWLMLAYLLLLQKVKFPLQNFGQNNLVRFFVWSDSEFHPHYSNGWNDLKGENYAEIISVPSRYFWVVIFKQKINWKKSWLWPSEIGLSNQIYFCYQKSFLLAYLISLTFSHTF